MDPLEQHYFEYSQARTELDDLERNEIDSKSALETSADKLRPILADYNSEKSTWKGWFVNLFLGGGGFSKTMNSFFSNFSWFKTEATRLVDLKNKFLEARNDFNEKLEGWEGTKQKIGQFVNSHPVLKEKEVLSTEQSTCRLMRLACGGDGEFFRLPSLQLDKENSKKTYIDNIDPEKMTHRVMKFIDESGRKGLAVRVKVDGGKETFVQTFHERFSNDKKYWVTGEANRNLIRIRDSNNCLISSGKVDIVAFKSLEELIQTGKTTTAENHQLELT